MINRNAEFINRLGAYLSEHSTKSSLKNRLFHIHLIRYQSQQIVNQSGMFHN